jgi:hypothetical protein
MLIETSKQKEKSPTVTQFFKTLLDKNECKAALSDDFEQFAVSQVPDIIGRQFRIPNLLENKIQRLRGNRTLYAPLSKKPLICEPIVYRNNISKIQRSNSYPLVKADNKDEHQEGICQFKGQRQSLIFGTNAKIDQTKIEAEWVKLKALHKQEKAKRKVPNNRLHRIGNKKEGVSLSELNFQQIEDPKNSVGIDNRFKRKMSRFAFETTSLLRRPDTDQSPMRRQSRITSNSLSLSHNITTRPLIPKLQLPPPIEDDSNYSSEIDTIHTRKSTMAKKSLLGNSPSIFG